MDIYGKKKNAYKNVGFFCAIILAFLIGDLICPDIFFSENENRILTSKPKISKEGLLQGIYMEKYEAYMNDQFVGRNNWIRLKTYSDILLQKKEINGVYLAEDGYLIEQHPVENYDQETIESKITLLQQLCRRFPQTCVMLVPTADNILQRKMPLFAPAFDQREFLNQVKEAVGEEKVIDLFPILEEHEEEEIYYRTDHHWTTLGAYYGYQSFAKAYGLPAKNYLRKEPVAVTESFQGTLQSKLNLPQKAEKIYMFPQTMDKEYEITYDGVRKTGSFYEEKYLTGKNKYGYFLDDNHGIVEIERKSYSKKVLFVIKDSYANSMIPLLAHHYKKVYIVDPRYFNGDLFSYMDSCNEYKDMDVLVLYDCIHFIEDFKYN